MTVFAIMLTLVIVLDVIVGIMGFLTYLDQKPSYVRQLCQAILLGIGWPVLLAYIVWSELYEAYQYFRL